MGKEPVGSRLKAGKATVSGLKVVTIPLEEYEALLDAKRRLQDRPQGRKPTSPIEKNPEIRAFIDSRLGTMTYAEIAAACKETFGVAPSTSAIHRYYWRRKP